MLQTTLLLIIIFIVAIVLALAFALLNKKYKKRWIDYYVMFLIGVGWTILGLLFKIWLLVAIGGFFAILGYVRRKQWDDDLTGLGKANKEEILLLRQQTDTLEFTLGIVIFAGILILLGVIIYMYLVSSGFI
jgi:uncharacterized membrane protein